jgi:hypothetical protein
MGAYGGRGEPPVSIKESKNPTTMLLPNTFSLFQNYPNPFNPSTTISFEVTETFSINEKISLTVYDIRGRRVRTLIDSDLEPGSHKIHWNGQNDRGQSVASGIYMYTLKAGEEMSAQLRARFSYWLRGASRGRCLSAP